jgi:uncharacterized protein YbjT (DUF2867 family)
MRGRPQTLHGTSPPTPLTPMAEKILVTGATGKVGSELVRLLSERGRDVKAATRTPSAQSELAGVEVVELDYTATETWDAAVQWADRVFLVPPPFDPRSDDRLVPFLDWAVQSGSRHVVLLSAMGAEARQQMALRRIEQRIERTGVGWTFLRPNIYMQNFARGFVARQIRENGEFRLPAGDARVSFVDGRDVAAVAEKVLSEDSHFGKAYTLTGPEALTHADAAGIIAEIADRPVVYRPNTEEEMREALGRAGWATDQADTFSRLLSAIRERVREPVTDDLEAVLNRPASSFRQFARDHAEAWQ